MVLQDVATLWALSRRPTTFQAHKLGTRLSLIHGMSRTAFQTRSLRELTRDGGDHAPVRLPLQTPAHMSSTDQDEISHSTAEDGFWSKMGVPAHGLRAVVSRAFIC